MKRRNFLLGTAGLLGLAWWLKPGNNGGAYSGYFQALNDALKVDGPPLPLMVVDLDLVDRNIAAIKASIRAQHHYRVVAKSIPSLDLIEYVMKGAGTNRVMGFHQPFLNQMATRMPEADILVGKPLPVRAAADFYQQLKGDFKPEKQLQWLIDTPERLAEYQVLAQAQDLQLRINIELNVGLNRGGVSDEATLLAMLSRIASDAEHLEFAGFMGYDPHVVKVPGIIASREELHQAALGRYQKHLDTVGKHYPDMLKTELTLNAAGSPTYRLYEDVEMVNDLAAGSCIVKPADFDIDTLASHVPAAFIATPVLKRQEGMQVPGIEKFGPVLEFWDPNLQQSFFTYGGYWKAKPENPPGLQTNAALYGRSTNQELLTGSDRVPMRVGDYAFLRPTQSEFVFLQFGDLVITRGASLLDRWPVMVN